MNSFMLN